MSHYVSPGNPLCSSILPSWTLTDTPWRVHEGMVNFGSSFFNLSSFLQAPYVPPHLILQGHLGFSSSCRSVILMHHLQPLLSDARPVCCASHKGSLRALARWVDEKVLRVAASIAKSWASLSHCPCVLFDAQDELNCALPTSATSEAVHSTTNFGDRRELRWLPSSTEGMSEN